MLLLLLLLSFFFLFFLFALFLLIFPRVSKSADDRTLFRVMCAGNARKSSADIKFGVCCVFSVVSFERSDDSPSVVSSFELGKNGHSGSKMSSSPPSFAASTHEKTRVSSSKNNSAAIKSTKRKRKRKRRRELRGLLLFVRIKGVVVIRSFF